jgi:hypothetical protein
VDWNSLRILPPECFKNLGKKLERELAVEPEIGPERIRRNPRVRQGKAVILGLGEIAMGTPEPRRRLSAPGNIDISYGV